MYKGWEEKILIFFSANQSYGVSRATRATHAINALFSIQFGFHEPYVFHLCLCQGYNQGEQVGW
jgi:hypothetical protein